MSFEQIRITRSIIVLEKSVLHQDWSKFSDNSNESLKMAQNPKMRMVYASYLRYDFGSQISQTGNLGH